MSLFHGTLAFAAGAAVGGLYFAVLWAATRAFIARGPAWIFVAAAAARIALVLGAVAAALQAGAGVGALAAAGLGFLLVRVLATRAANTPGRPV